MKVLYWRLDLKDEDIKRISKLQKNNEDLSNETENLIKMRKFLEANCCIEKYIKKTKNKKYMI